jgi:tRNA A-37 threonylcarbamoyl transferase component Bud32
MTPTVLGKYEIRGVLGRGAAGIVYDAWDPVIARRVAIKTVKLPSADDPETEEEMGRFRREAQAAGRLSHPNIVPVFDYGETDEIAYIVMEHVGGGSLKRLMDEAKQVPPADALRVMEQLLSGLQFSHERGIVHRDIKPANVMLSDEQTVKITDFGIARIEGSGATMVGTLLGTPAYMSPEQWRGEISIDARSDIYAAGVLLYHMLTGRRPFEGSNQSAIMHQALNGEIDRPSAVAPGISPALDAVVLKAMARRPEDRYQSASAFAAAMRQAVADGGSDPVLDATMVQPSRASTARPPPAVASASTRAAASATRRPEQAPPRRTGAVIAGLAAVTILGGGGAAWFLLGSHQPAVIANQEAETAKEVAAPAATDSRAAEPPATAAEPHKPADQAVVAPARAPEIEPPPAQVAAPPGLHEVLASAPCAAVYGENSTDLLALRGIVPQTQYAALRSSFDQTAAQSRSWDVLSFPALDIYCRVIDTLRPALRGLGDRGGITASLLPSASNHSSQLVDNDPIDFNVSGPNFASVLQVDYIDSTGKVSHYMPRKAAPAFAARRIKPDEHVRLFDFLQGPAFRVGPPAGTDLVVIIASSEPLQEAHALDDDEPVATYVTELRTAVDAALRRGVRLSVELLPVVSVDTSAK